MSTQLLFARPLSIRRTTLMTGLFLSFLIGVVCSRFGMSGSVGIVVLSAILCVALYRKNSAIRLIVVLCMGLSVGLWRGSVFLHRIDPYTEMYDQKVMLEVVAEEDAVYDDRSQLSFGASKIIVLSPDVGPLPGRIKVSGFGENMIYRGDRLELTGTLRATRGGRQGYISYAQLKVIQRGDSAINEFRRRFMAGMLNALPEPMASFGAGLLIGQRTTLPESNSEELSAVGLTHIVAVSGYNLTIIVEAVRRLTSRGSKYQGMLISLTLVGMFLLITGFSPPIVRAAVVSALGLWAWYFGRSWKPWLLIVCAASITVYWNPLYIWGDISWYLSFLSFFGVLILAPAIVRRVYRKREPKFLHSIIIETLSAQVLTIPLILFVFQRVSYVAILSNILVVPLVPFAMLLSVVAGLAGMFIPAVAGWFSWPARILLTYMLDVARILSKIPNVVGTYALSVAGLVWLYIVELGLSALLWYKTRPKYGIITDNNPEM